MNHIIVGTAGHVDHGKTQLTMSLTGINTDSLPEEKKRGMTIELGFVPFVLPSGIRLGLIDVPGHERFIKTMLAGVAGIDMALLVVAADEGVMPQTREHLNILHLLGIDKGVVVISKKDLADEEWLTLISEQVNELVSATTLADAPLVTVSAHTGEGLDELRQILDKVAATVPQKPDSGHPRLPIDRVFSKVGFGTVVTGTLWQGTLSVGQTIEIWPGGHRVRLRGLQVHGRQVEQALAGQRTAVNVSGLPVGALPKGGWLALPKLLRESWRLDVELRLLNETKPLQQRCRLHLHHGTAEVLCRLNLLDREELLPGESCFCQLLLEKPLPPLRKDKLILRSYSPMLVIAGATVLDANPLRHKRYRAEVIAEIRQHAVTDTSSILKIILERQCAFFNISELAKESQLPHTQINPLLKDLISQGKLTSIFIDDEEFYASLTQLNLGYEKVKQALFHYHQDFPLRYGLSVATARTKYFPRLNQKQFMALIQKWCKEEMLSQEKGCLSLKGFTPQPSGEQQKWLQQLEMAYANNLFDPPYLVDEMEALKIPQTDHIELVAWLCVQGILTKLAEGLYIHTKAITVAQNKLKRFKDNGFTLAQARDTLATTRKYTLPILEYLDREKITKRVEDKRILL